MSEQPERPAPGSPALSELLRNLREEFMTLLHQEVDLAKTEMNEKVSRITKDMIAIGAGAGVATAGALVLLMGIGVLASHGYEAAGLSVAVAAWLGPVTVGLLTALIGWLMISAGKKKLSRESAVPERTVETLRDHKTWARNKLRRSHA